jgi:hypothetical protein
MKSERKNMLVARMRLESIPVQIPREVAVVVVVVVETVGSSGAVAVVLVEPV